MGRPREVSNKMILDAIKDLEIEGNKTRSSHAVRLKIGERFRGHKGKGMGSPKIIKQFLDKRLEHTDKKGQNLTKLEELNSEVVAPCEETEESRLPPGKSIELSEKITKSSIQHEFNEKINEYEKTLKSTRDEIDSVHEYCNYLKEKNWLLTQRNVELNNRILCLEAINNALSDGMDKSILVINALSLGSENMTMISKSLLSMITNQMKNKLKTDG